MAVTGKTTALQIPFYEQTDSPPNIGTVTKAMAERLEALFAQMVPAGSIMATARTSATSGYLLCNGEAVSRTTYSKLYEAIGTAYGAGNGSTTFNLPNLVERVAVGKGTSMALGSAGGEKTHTLTEAELASHAHGVYDPGHAHYIDVANFNEWVNAHGNVSSTVPVTNGMTTHPATTGIGIYPTGGNGAHNNMQPYQVVNYLIKT